MKAYQVQFVLPVDNPENNVRRINKKDVIHFEVPINHPNINNLGIEALMSEAKAFEDSQKILCPSFKNKIEKDSSKE